MISMTVKVKEERVGVMQAYVPQTGRVDEEKEQFEEELEDTF